MTDDRLDERLRQAAEAYHRPPEDVPRDAMWAQIVAARAAGTRPQTPVRHMPPWWMLAAAAVVLVAGGIALGRLLPGGPAATTTVAQSHTPDRSDSATVARYGVATNDHFTRAEALLVAFRTDAAQGRVDAQMSAWARDLLGSTRLLLDSPAARDPARRQLLIELELVLAQIVQLAPGPGAPHERLDGVLTDDQLLMKLRVGLPAPQRGI